MGISKNIQCPSCGSNSVFKLNSREYKCNYCQTPFIYSEDESGVPPDLYVNEKKSKVQQYIDLQAINEKQKPVSKAGCVIFAAVIVGVIGFVGAIVFLVSNKKHAIEPSVNIETDKSWGKPSLNRYLAFAASKGPVVWELLEYSRSGLDSSKHYIRIVNPVNGEVKNNIRFGEVTTWKENFNFSKKLNYDFLLVNDTLYNGSEDGGLQAFDVYTGRKLFGNEYFENKFAELKKGIAKTESRTYYKAYTFTTNDGDEFTYYPGKHLLKNQEEEKQTYRSDTITRQNFYFSEGKKCFLYLAVKKESVNEGGTLSEYYIDAYEKKEKFYTKYFKKLEKLGNKSYPCAQRITSNENYVVFAYMSDFSNKAHPIIEKVDASGITVWQNSDTALVSFIENFSGNNLYLNYNLNKQNLLLYGSGKGYKTVGLDLNSGKTIFVHRQSYNIE